MPSSSFASVRIPGYDLASPTEADAVAALRRVFGAERGAAAWRDACAAAGERPGSVADAPRLSRVVDSLAVLGGAAATVARALTIRMRTYERLAARAADAGVTR